MSERHLLLPSAKMGVLVSSPTWRVYLRWAFLLVGIAVVIIGLANVLSRIGNYVSGAETAQTAFAPLGTLDLFGGTPVHTEAQAAAPETQSGVPVFTTIATTTPIIPARLKIASIGVDAYVEHVGKKTDGSMATPSSFENTGWYEFGSKPGQAGNAVIAGHVNNALTMPGIFQHLSDVKVGDYITVSDTSGKTLTYVVVENAQYPVDAAPTAQIFSQTGPSQLVLITCDGAWDPAARSYNKRLVVYAQLTAR